MEAAPACVLPGCCGRPSMRACRKGPRALPWLLQRSMLAGRSSALASGRLSTLAVPPWSPGRDCRPAHMAPGSLRQSGDLFTDATVLFRAPHDVSSVKDAGVALQRRRSREARSRGWRRVLKFAEVEGAVVHEPRTAAAEGAHDASVRRTFDRVGLPGCGGLAMLPRGPREVAHGGQRR
jgi:hypothetical protein